MNWLVIIAVGIYAIMCIAVIVMLCGLFHRTPKNLKGYYCIPVMLMTIIAMILGGIALTLACLG